MLLFHCVRNRTPNPNNLLCISTDFSRFTSQSSSSPNPNTRSPPRKGRQAVRRISKLLSSKPQNPNLSETLEKLESSPETLSSIQASELVTAISNPLISFDFYRFLRSWRPIFKPESVLYASLIRSQLQSDNPHLPRVQYYLDEMKKNKITLSHDDFRSFFCLVVPNCGEIAGFFVREVLERIEFDEGSYNYAISVYAKHGFCKEAILVAEKARLRVRSPSLGFYSCVMDVYKVNGNARGAMKLFLEMEERGVLADEGVYRVLLEILCRVGWVKLCWTILEEMIQAGFRPDECLAKRLMKMFLKEGLITEAGFFFSEGILKDEESLVVFGETMAMQGKPSTALELLNNIGSGCDIGGSVFASVIRGCGKMGLVNDAEKIFAEIKTLEGVENQRMVYSSIVYVYSRAGMRRMAEMVMKEMEVSTGFTGSSEVFVYMMSMYGALGLVSDVVKMFDECKKTGGGFAVADAYVVLIDALSKSGKLNQARDSLMEMRSLGMNPSSSIYSSMMEGYLRVGLFNHAIALFDEYKISGLEVDEVVAGSIVKVLIQANRYSELGFYLDKLMNRGIKISRDDKALVLEMCKDDFCFSKLRQLLQ